MSALVELPRTLPICKLDLDLVNRKTDQIDSEDPSQILNSLKSLLLKYKMYSKSSDSQVASGGLQQFITRKMKAKADQQKHGSFSLSQRLRALYSKDETTILCDSEESSMIQCLPVDSKLHIFSFLDAKSLCMACCVNQEWSELACDDLLWQRLLQQNMNQWSQMSHLTNPQLYQDVNSDWSSKEIYLRCCPEFHKQFRQSNSAFIQVSSVLKYFLPKKAPKVAMFGPGLEQSTSEIVRKMIYLDNPLFTRVAMFPGQFDGVGGGMTLKLQSGQSLNLSILYSASRKQREGRDGQDRIQQNRMLQVQAPGDGAVGNEEPQYELQPQIKHFCQTLDAFIFVIDASQSKESISSNRIELITMIKERRSTPHIPILVLSCIQNEAAPRIPACQIVELLQLSSISQPWLVIDCITETLTSVDTGIIWLIEQSQFK